MDRALVRLVVCVLLLPLPASAAPPNGGKPGDANSLTPEETQLGFKLLFNGRDLQDWQQHENWGVEEGAIVCSKEGSELVQRKEPALPDAFELRFEFKLSDAAFAAWARRTFPHLVNVPGQKAPYSGLISSPEPARFELRSDGGYPPKGPSQMQPGEEYRADGASIQIGQRYHLVGRSGVAIVSEEIPVEAPPGGPYFAGFELDELSGFPWKVYRRGKWNAGRIIAKGTVVQHWLNGSKFVDVDILDLFFKNSLSYLSDRPDSVIGLKALQNCGMVMYACHRGLHLEIDSGVAGLSLRAIKLRPLPPGEELDRTPIPGALRNRIEFSLMGVGTPVPHLEERCGKNSYAAIADSYAIVVDDTDGSVRLTRQHPNVKGPPLNQKELDAVVKAISGTRGVKRLINEIPSPDDDPPAARKDGKQ